MIGPTGFHDGGESLWAVYPPAMAEHPACLTPGRATAPYLLRVAGSSLTVAAYLAQWLRDDVDPLRRPRTRHDYRRLCEKEIAPRIGHVRLARLRVDDIKRLRREMLAAGKGQRTIQYTHAVLRKALNDAITDGYIQENVAARVRMPRRSRRTRATHSVDDMRRALDAVAGSDIETQIEFLVRTGVRTGVRRGEASGLRWAHVHLDQGWARIHESLLYISGQRLVFEPTKRHRSDRLVRLGPGLVASLRRHREQQLEHRIFYGQAYWDHDLVFCWEDGRPRDPSNVLKRFQRLLRAAGLPHMTLRQLRHVFATSALVAGAPVSAVSDQLGHASVTTTLQFYVDSVRDAQAQAVDSARRHMAGTGGGWKRRTYAR